MLNKISLLIVVYIVFISMVAFILFGVDKRRAKYNKWRISEFTLFMTVILGGGIGAMLGMHIFRHKTKRMRFKILIPIITIVTLFVFSIPLLNNILN